MRGKSKDRTKDGSGAPDALPGLYAEPAAAGFPSPAEGYREGSLDLNELLVKNPPATFFVRASGDSMTGAGIFHGDILVVDRSVEPVNGKIIVAAVDGGFVVKRLEIGKEGTVLRSENPGSSDIRPEDGGEGFRAWGVVTAAIHVF